MYDKVALPTQPPHHQRLPVILMMLLCHRVMAHGTRLGQKLAPALVHVCISTGHGPLTLNWIKVHVPRTTGPGIRSMAHATVALGQAIVWLPAL